jgi:hypothetical protein
MPDTVYHLGTVFIAAYPNKVWHEPGEKVVMEK